MPHLKKIKGNFSLNYLALTTDFHLKLVGSKK